MAQVDLGQGIYLDAVEIAEQTTQEILAEILTSSDDDETFKTFKENASEELKEKLKEWLNAAETEGES